MIKKLLAITCVLSLVACGQEKQVVNNVQNIKANINAKQAYALRGADQTWPGGTPNDVVISENLQARNFYVIFDGSGSMADKSCGEGKRRVDAAKHSVGQFFDALPKNVNAGLLVFDNKGLNEASAIQQVNPSTLSAAINTIKSGGTTPLGQSLQTGLQKLTTQAQKQQGYGEYHLVVITDGAASDQKLMTDMVDSITQKTPINIHTIGFCLNSSHALNKQGVVNYSSASSSTQLVNSLKAVLAEAESFDTTQFQGS